MVLIFDVCQHPLWFPFSFLFPIEILELDSVQGCQLKIYFYMYYFPSGFAPPALCCNIVKAAYPYFVTMIRSTWPLLIPYAIHISNIFVPLEKKHIDHHNQSHIDKVKYFLSCSHGKQPEVNESLGSFLFIIIKMLKFLIKLNWYHYLSIVGYPCDWCGASLQLFDWLKALSGC